MVRDTDQVYVQLFLVSQFILLAMVDECLEFNPENYWQKQTSLFNELYSYICLILLYDLYKMFLIYGITHILLLLESVLIDLSRNSKLENSIYDKIFITWQSECLNIDFFELCKIMFNHISLIAFIVESRLYQYFSQCPCRNRITGIIKLCLFFFSETVELLQC